MKNATPNNRYADIQPSEKVLKVIDIMFFTLYFKDERMRIRKVCKIPDDKYDFNEEILHKILEGNNISNYKIIDGFTMPDVSELEFIIKRILTEEIADIRNKLEIKDNLWVDVLIKSKIIFNEVDLFFLIEKITEKYPNIIKNKNLVQLSTSQEEYDKYVIEEERFDSNGKSYYEPINEKQLEGLNDYPIILKIHKGAGKNDIEDFINKNWEEIELLQVKNGKMFIEDIFDTNNPILQEINDRYFEDKIDQYKNSKTELDSETRKKYKIISENIEKKDNELLSILVKNGISIETGNISKIKSFLKNKYKE